MVPATGIAPETHADLKSLFNELAVAQRGEPEKAMLRVQFTYGGGVMNLAVEHIGDLTHRMSESVTFDSGGYLAVQEKVRKAIGWLTHAYGFEREFEENIRTNARCLQVPEVDFRAKVYAAMAKYAEAHAALPAHNKAQALAREAAVALGLRHYGRCLECLRQLAAKLGSEEEWVRFAHESALTSDE